MTSEFANDQPAPLVPAEVDLRNFTWLPLDATFVNRAAFLLASGDELKAHIALLCRAWSEVPAASLPSDDRLLAALSCAGTRWQKVKAAALTGFVLCTDDRYYHVALSTKAIEAWGRSKAGSENARKRWHRAASAPADATGNASASTEAYAAASPTAILGEERRGKEKKPKSSSSSDDDGAFEQFWTAYPRKVGKTAAKKAWTRLKPTNDVAERMFVAVEKQRRSEQWTRDRGLFIPHPATWLKGGRWEDELGAPVAIASKPRTCFSCGATGSMVETHEGPKCMPCYRS